MIHGVARYLYRVTTPSGKKTDYRRLTSSEAARLRKRGYICSGE